MCVWDGSKGGMSQESVSSSVTEFMNLWVTLWSISWTIVCDTVLLGTHCRSGGVFFWSHNVTWFSRKKLAVKITVGQLVCVMLEPFAFTNCQNNSLWLVTETITAVMSHQCECASVVQSTLTKCLADNHYKSLLQTLA